MIHTVIVSFLFFLLHRLPIKELDFHFLYFQGQNLQSLFVTDCQVKNKRKNVKGNRKTKS